MPLTIRLRCFLRPLAKYVTASQKEKEVEEVFRMMDRNKDGVISQKEFLQFLKKYGHERDDKHLLNLFHMADCNDDKRLSLNELKAILCQKH
ncbi:EF hand [Opisthorchis viverrini]|uniref:EF hand n=1 Tax=Opisthorchis viverrini TaxID=6198 RepID=A0A1S8WPQ9_OPIVI|nr:EF hand [Opisthorchis viverrini]